MGLVNWSPNDVTEDVSPVIDWGARCICLKVFQSVTLSDSEYLRPVGALLLEIFSVRDFSDVRVEREFAPLCPLDIAHTGLLFTTSAGSSSHFLSEAAAAIVCREIADSGKKVIDSVIDLTSSSEVMKSKFEQCCRNAVSTRKRCVRDVFFWIALL